MSTPRSKPSVLVIDDEPLQGELLSQILGNDFLVTFLSNSQEANREIQKTEFDIIVTDLHMPESTTTTILSTAKKYWPSTPVIVVSGSKREDPEVQMALGLGASVFIQKPFPHPTQLIDLLKACLVAKLRPSPRLE